jgi:hypothetical protein
VKNLNVLAPARHRQSWFLENRFVEGMDVTSVCNSIAGCSRLFDCASYFLWRPAERAARSDKNDTEALLAIQHADTGVLCSVSSNGNTESQPSKSAELWARAAMALRRYLETGSMGLMIDLLERV